MTFGNEDFQVSVKKAVAKDECFKAFPTCFSHVHCSFITAALRKSSAFKDVCLSEAGVDGGFMFDEAASQRRARHAVRVKVVRYPEQMCAVWVMVAVIFPKF